jgi:hypothetical protein
MKVASCHCRGAFRLLALQLTREVESEYRAGSALSVGSSLLFMKYHSHYWVQISTPLKTMEVTPMLFSIKEFYACILDVIEMIVNGRGVCLYSNDY